MKETKFFRLFATLDKKEVNKFEAYLRGLYPRQKNASTLLSYFKKNRLKTETNKLDINFVLSSFYKYRSPTDQQRKNLLNLLSDLFGYLNEFLLLQKIKQKSIHTQFQLLDIYKERKLDSFFFQKTKRLQKELKSAEQKSLEEYLYLMLLAQKTFYHTNYYKLDNKECALDETMNCLDQFFCLAKFKLSAEMLNREIILQKKYDIQFLEEVSAYVKRNSKNMTVVELYAMVVQFQKNRSHENYQQLKDKIFSSIHRIASEDKAVFLSYLLNYVSQKIKSGERSYYQEAFDLFEFGLEHKIFINDDKYISPTKFINIVAVSCSINKMEWAEKFIAQWQKHLKSDKKDITVKIALAYIEFEKKQFEKSIEILNAIPFCTPFFSLRIRGLILKSHYENNHKKNRQLIVDYCKAFKIYLGRNKTIGENTILAYAFFIKMVKKMLREKEDPETLRKEILEAKHIVNKAWLLEKIKVLFLELVVE